MVYRPRHPDTSGIPLSPAILELIRSPIRKTLLLGTVLSACALAALPSLSSGERMPRSIQIG